MRTAFVFALGLLAACGTPGQRISPQPGDFAFVEIKLRG